MHPLNPFQNDLVTQHLLQSRHSMLQSSEPEKMINAIQEKLWAHPNVCARTALNIIQTLPCSKETKTAGLFALFFTLSLTNTAYDIFKDIVLAIRSETYDDQQLVHWYSLTKFLLQFCVIYSTSSIKDPRASNVLRLELEEYLIANRHALPLPSAPYFQILKAMLQSNTATCINELKQAQREFETHNLIYEALIASLLCSTISHLEGEVQEFLSVAAGKVQVQYICGLGSVT